MDRVELLWKERENSYRDVSEQVFMIDEFLGMVKPIEEKVEDNVNF